MYNDPNEGLYDLLAIAFGVIAVIFGYANTRKNGDSFVAVGAFIVAAVAWGWAYLN
jgi:RsiW-degrading membrane proteinase PrsW (M82 family)